MQSADDDHSALGCGRYWSRQQGLWAALASNVWTGHISLAERFPGIAMDIAVPNLAEIDATESARPCSGLDYSLMRKKLLGKDDL